MKMMDEAGALASMRHAQQRVVTVAVDQMIFHEPIRIGDLVTITAEVSFVGNTSMEAEVLVTAEDPISGKRTYTNKGYLVYVALDPEGAPFTVPKLVTENEKQRKRMEKGQIRQSHRLSQS